MSEEIKTEQVEKQPEVEDNGIVVSSLEDDMNALGVQTEVKQESKEEDTQPKEEAKDEVKQPKKSRSQRRIERLAKENQELKEQLETQESKPQAKEDALIPDAEDFENYEDYEKALEDFNNPPVKAKPEQQPNEDARIADMREDGVEEYEDFEELVTAPDLALTQSVLNEALEAENPADIVYYLATHKDEAKKIAGMSPRQMSKALVKIEMDLEKKPAKKTKVTKAPEPIKPVEGGSATVKSLNDNDLSFEDHERLLNSRKAQSPGGFI